MQPLVAGLSGVHLDFAQMAGGWRQAGTDSLRSPFGHRRRIHGMGVSSGENFQEKRGWISPFSVLDSRWRRVRTGNKEPPLP